jgi:hypothetical protein
MITEYIEAALSKARYEIIEDEEPYYGEVQELEGLPNTFSFYKRKPVLKEKLFLW